MLDKVKTGLKVGYEFLVNHLVLIVVSIVGLLVLLFTSKNEEVEKLKAKLGLVDTQRKADLLEAEITQKLNNKDLLDKETKQLEGVLNTLQQKRVDLQKGADLTPEEVAAFWKEDK